MSRRLLTEPARGAPVSLQLVPITLTAARRFVFEYHRHNFPPQGWLFGVGVQNGGSGLAGVAVVSRPVARALQDGRTVEITRSATDGTKNANSKLYAALCRAAAALGYTKAITYTLVSESGASLRAAGFTIEAGPLPVRSWAEQSGRARYEANLLGERVSPDEERYRWGRRLA